MSGPIQLRLPTVLLKISVTSFYYYRHPLDNPSITFLGPLSTTTRLDIITVTSTSLHWYQYASFTDLKHCLHYTSYSPFFLSSYWVCKDRTPWVTTTVFFQLLPLCKSNPVQLKPHGLSVGSMWSVKLFTWISSRGSRPDPGHVLEVRGRTVI